MFKIEKVYSRANLPKTIRFTEELDAKLTALASGENIPLMNWFYAAVSMHLIIMKEM